MRCKRRAKPASLSLRPLEPGAAAPTVRFRTKLSFSGRSRAAAGPDQANGPAMAAGAAWKAARVPLSVAMLHPNAAAAISSRRSRFIFW